MVPNTLLVGYYPYWTYRAYLAHLTYLSHSPNPTCWVYLPICLFVLFALLDLLDSSPKNGHVFFTDVV